MSIKELNENNKRLCLSALRVFNKCYECIMYERCESRIINKEYEQKQERIKELKKQIQEIEEEIKNLDTN